MNTMTVLSNISLSCGPNHDTRIFNLELPSDRYNIGVLVSGGLDSALLYYFLRLLGQSRYTITPYTLIRNDGSNVYAQLVIDYVNNILSIEKQLTTFVNVKEEHTELQVYRGVLEVHRYRDDVVYVGVIETLPDHSIGVSKSRTPIDTEKRRFPFKHLNKSHIVDLVTKLGLQKLFEITHSCVYPSGRCNICNRCKERMWAFTQLGLADIGIH